MNFQNTERDEYGRNCFNFHGAKLWNSLDTRFKCAKDLKSFKERFRSWNGQDCTCQACDLCLVTSMYLFLAKLMSNDIMNILAM